MNNQVIGIGKSSADTLRELAEVLEKDPSEHQYVFVMTANRALDSWNWEVIGRPNLIKLLGLVEIVKLELVETAKELTDEDI